MRELQSTGDGFIHTVEMRRPSKARAQCGLGLPEIADLASHALIEGRSHDLGERLPIDAEDVSQLM